MQGEGDIGVIIAKVLNKIFKNRPNCAIAIFTFLIIVVLSAMLFKAQNPDDLVFPILGLTFVLIVILGSTIRAIRQKSIQEYQVIEETSLDQDKPLDRETPLQLTENQLQKAPLPKQQNIQYPRLTAKDRRKFMIISVFFFAFGYFLVQFVVANMLPAQTNQQIIDFLSPELYKSFIKEVYLQLICGLPCALPIFILILVVLSAKFNQLAKSNLKILSITYAILGFIFGILFYIPIQIFLTLMLAIGGYETHT